MRLLATWEAAVSYGLKPCNTEKATSSIGTNIVVSVCVLVYHISEGRPCSRLRPGGCDEKGERFAPKLLWHQEAESFL